MVDWTKPIETIEGLSARVLCTDRDDPLFPVITVTPLLSILIPLVVADPLESPLKERLPLVVVGRTVSA